MPVLKDLPFIKALDLTAGYRLSDYNTVGKVDAYKLNGDWEIVEGFRLRGGYQRAVRAPSMSARLRRSLPGAARAPLV